MSVICYDLESIIISMLGIRYWFFLVDFLGFLNLMLVFCGMFVEV